MGKVRKLLTSATKRIVRLRSRPLVVQRRGALFVLDPQNWIDNRLIAGAPYENAQIANAQSLIETHNIDLVVDVGANFGLYTVLLGKLDRIEKVIAFEPVRQNFAQLMANVFANKLSDKTNAYCLGAWSAEDTATIHIDPKSTGVSRLDLTTTHRAASVFRASEVISLIPLDTVLDMQGRRVFMKMDIEGAAHHALQGMKNFLSRNKVFIQVELVGTEAEQARTLLEALRYVQIDRIDSDYIFAPN